MDVMVGAATSANVKEASATAAASESLPAASLKNPTPTSIASSVAPTEAVPPKLLRACKSACPAEDSVIVIVSSLTTAVSMSLVAKAFEEVPV